MNLNYGYTIVEVQGDSCANCITLMPIIRNITAQRDDLTLLTIPMIPETKAFFAKYEVEKLPTVLLLYNEELIGKITGMQPEEILEYWIDSKIEEHKANNK